MFAHLPIKYYTMKNLKKINRENLKSITGGRPPADGGCSVASCPSGYKDMLL
jgi:hypothetical protein